MTALHWPSVLEINYNRVLVVVVVVVQRHVPCEQNDMGFQCSRKAPLAHTHSRATDHVSSFPLQTS